MDQEIECLHCGEPFTSKRGGRLCRNCKAERTKAARAERDAEAAAMHQRIAGLIGAGEHVPTVAAIKREMLKAGIVTTRDRQPEGWLSRWGSDEGESTYIKAVSETLTAKRAELRESTEANTWFEDNPHWAVGIPGSERMLQRVGTPMLSCAGKRGTPAGYRRHQRDKSMACQECMAAWREYLGSRGYQPTT